MTTQLNTRHPFELLAAMETAATEGDLKKLLNELIGLWASGVAGEKSMVINKEVEIDDEHGKSVFTYTYMATIKTVAKEVGDEDSSVGED